MGYAVSQDSSTIHLLKRQMPSTGAVCVTLDISKKVNTCTLSARSQ